MQYPYPLDFGRPREITIPNPAPGANFSQSVDTNSIWLPLSLTFRFICSAVAATRRVQIAYRIGAIQLFRSDGTRDAIASEDNFYHFATWGHPNVGSQAGSNFSHLPHRFFLTETGSIISQVNNIQAADQLSAITLYVLEWLHVQ